MNSDDGPMQEWITIENRKKKRLEKNDEIIELMFSRPNNFDTSAKELLVQFNIEPKKFPLNISAAVGPKCRVKFLVNFSAIYPNYKDFHMQYEGHSIHIIPTVLKNTDIDDNFDLELLKQDKLKQEEYNKQNFLAKKKKLILSGTLKTHRATNSNKTDTALRDKNESNASKLLPSIGN
jgi:hypothetical protein